MSRIQEAFAAYRHSIDKDEASADTWCSIGILYQQQGQKMDALQAYICSVRLDRYHDAAWYNLGLLYESVGQSKDALIAFTNHTEILKPDTSNEILQKLSFHGEKLNELQSGSDGGSLQLPRVIPFIEEAWRLPIPHELIERLKPMKFGWQKVPQNGLQGNKGLRESLMTNLLLI